MADNDPMDINGDGLVTADEINSVVAKSAEGASQPPWWLPPLRVAYQPISMLDAREREQKRQELLAKYAPQEAASTVRDAVNSTQSYVDSALGAATVPSYLSGAGGTSKTSTGFLGMDALVEAGAAVVETGEVDENGVPVTRVMVRRPITVDGRTVEAALPAKYASDDPLRTLAGMNDEQLYEWRKTMWLAGTLDPVSFVGPVTQEDVAALTEAMTSANLTGIEWTDVVGQRAQMGARYGRPITEGEIAELGADVPSILQGLAAQNGVSVSSDYVARAQRRVQSGMDTPESVARTFMDNYVKPLYPQYADDFDRGVMLEDIAAPYKAQMSAMLEIPEDSIGLDDPTLQAALTGVKDGRMSLWEFEGQLANDPRWEFTNNAYDTYGSAVNGMISEMGL